MKSELLFFEFWELWGFSALGWRGFGFIFVSLCGLQLKSLGVGLLGLYFLVVLECRVWGISGFRHLWFWCFALLGLWGLMLWACRGLVRWDLIL